MAMASAVGQPAMNESSRPLPVAGGADRADVCYMVDCGSGYTRFEKYALRPGRRVHLVTPPTRLEAPPLAEVLAGTELQQRAWLAALAEALGDEGTAVVIGATAGVRDAVSSGAVAAATVQRFKQLVPEILGRRAVFEVMDGEAEAANELAAVRYCAGACEAAVGGGDVALLSSGGMSCQMVYGSPPRAVSLPHGQKDANALCLKVGVEEGLRIFGAKVEAMIASEEALRDVRGKLEGTFVGIEMLAGVAQSGPGIAGQVMSAADAKAAFERFLVDFRAKAARASPEEVAARTWKDVYRGTTGTVAVHLLGLLAPTAQVCFLHKFDVGDGQLLQPKWTLGRFVSSLPSTDD